MEQMVFQQIFHSAHALKKTFQISTFRTRGGLEVDFLLNLENQKFFIESKSSENLADQDADPLLQAKAYVPRSQGYIFHPGRKSLKLKGLWALPLAEGLKELGL
jgi:hypothetical protein